MTGFCSCKTGIQYIPVHKSKDLDTALKDVQHTDDYMDVGGRVTPGAVTELTQLSRKKDIFGVALIIIILFILLPLSPVQAEDNASLVAHECKRIGNKLGSVSIKNCLDIKLTATNGRSVKNAPILLKEYPPLERRSPLGKVLLLGGIHGDEYSSVSIVFKWMRILDPGFRLKEGKRLHAGMYGEPSTR